jgi:alpha-ribazole phosphatase
MKIVLIRHPTPVIAAGVCYGRLDVPADTEAAIEVRRQALKSCAAGVSRIWTSPARRCQELARSLAQSLAVTAIVDPRLQELDFGSWEGKSWDGVARAQLDAWAASPLTFRPPGGESGAELIGRVRDFHAELCRHRQTCIVVSHGGPLKVLASLLEGRPVDLLGSTPAIGSVISIDCTAGEPSA